MGSRRAGDRARGRVSSRKEVEAAQPRQARSSKKEMSEQILIDGDSLTVDEAFAVAADRIRVGLAPKARARMLRTRAVVDDIVRRDLVVYGVTTGFGKLSEVAIPHDKLAQLQVN